MFSVYMVTAYQTKFYLTRTRIYTLYVKFLKSRWNQNNYDRLYLLEIK